MFDKFFNGKFMKLFMYFVVFIICLVIVVFIYNSLSKNTLTQDVFQIFILPTNFTNFISEFSITNPESLIYLIVNTFLILLLIFWIYQFYDWSKLYIKYRKRQKCCKKKNGKLHTSDSKENTDPYVDSNLEKDDYFGWVVEINEKDDENLELHVFKKKEEH